MSLNESPEECYLRLCTNKGAKFLTSLNNIKDACDKIDLSGGEITYSSVGNMAVSLHGGPKAQSILNNPSHKEYIDARKRESIGKSSVAPKANSNLYPASDLDYKTRRFIDDLTQRNQLLENIIRELKQDLKKSTSTNPVDINLLLSGSNKTENSNANNGLSSQTARSLLELILALPSITEKIEFFEECSLRYSTGDWLLKPGEYNEIMMFIGALIEEKNTDN